MFTTDGRIIALDLVLLEDDRKFFPKYNPAITMRKEFAEAHPQVADVMAPISAALTNEEITELNRRVDVDGRGTGGRGPGLAGGRRDSSRCRDGQLPRSIFAIRPR